MKSIMKKIAMMGMLVCMASSNIYTSGSPFQLQVQSQLDSLSQSFATVAHDARLSSVLQNEYKSLTAAITYLMAPLKTGGTIDHKKSISVIDQALNFQADLKNDSQYKAYTTANPDKIGDLKDKMNELINTLCLASLQLQIDSLSKQFAAIPHDQKLDAEYKALTNAITDLLAPLKTGTKIDQTKKSNIQKNLDQFKIDINNDTQYKAYAAANPSTIKTLHDLISKVVTRLQNIDASSRPKNLMPEPTTEKPIQTVNIMVSNLPANTFIAAGVLYHNDDKTNYSIQGTGGNGLYNFHSNYYYAAAANDKQSFKNQHKGTDFLGKTKWDVTNNIIS